MVACLQLRLQHQSRHRYQVHNGVARQEAILRARERTTTQQAISGLVVVADRQPQGMSGDAAGTDDISRTHLKPNLVNDREGLSRREEPSCGGRSSRGWRIWARACG